MLHLRCSKTVPPDVSASTTSFVGPATIPAIVSVEAVAGICAVHATVWLVAEHRLVIPPLDEDAAPLDEDAAPLDEEDAPLDEDAAPLDDEDVPLDEEDDAPLLDDVVPLDDEDDEDEAPLLDELLADDAPPSLAALLEVVPPCVPQLATASAAGTEKSETRAKPLKPWERTTNAIIKRVPRAAKGCI